MRLIRLLPLGIYVLGPALLSLGLLSGCDNSPKTQDAPKGNEQEQADMQNKMKEFMAKKGKK